MYCIAYTQSDMSDMSERSGAMSRFDSDPDSDPFSHVKQHDWMWRVTRLVKYVSHNLMLVTRQDARFWFIRYLIYTRIDFSFPETP